MSSEECFTETTVQKSFSNTPLLPFNRADFVERTVCHLTGINLNAFHGNFFMRSADLLALPNVSPNNAYTFQLAVCLA